MKHDDIFHPAMPYELCKDIKTAVIEYFAHVDEPESVEEDDVIYYTDTVIPHYPDGITKEMVHDAVRKFVDSVHLTSSQNY